MPTTTNPRIYFLSREQVFRIEASGLQPLTYHSFYFERQKVAANLCKPQGGKLGDLLESDSDGKIVFDYYYSSGLSADATPLERAQQQANLAAGNKEVVLATVTSNTLSDTFKQSCLSYFVSHILIQVYLAPESEFAQVS